MESTGPAIAGEPIVLRGVADDTRFQGYEPRQAVAQVRYSFHWPSWKSPSWTAMIASDGLFDEPVESVEVTIPTEGLPAGRYLILVEARDANGNWGPPTGVFVDVIPSYTPFG